MSEHKKIVITGLGTISAAGNGNAEAWESIRNKNSGLVQKEYAVGGEAVGKFYLHEIKEFNIGKYGLNEQRLNELRNWKGNEDIVDLNYFLATIKMAIDDSALQINENNKAGIGLVLAHENIGLDHFYSKIIDELSFVDETKPVSKKEFLNVFYNKFRRTGYELQTFMALYHVAKVFDLHGFSLFLNNACASGLYAIEAAADIIRSGKCHTVIVAAVDHASIFKQLWFSEVNMLSHDGLIRPFSKKRDGFVLGDGGAAIVLEAKENAEKRNAPIYAEYVGGSFFLEGWKVTYPSIAEDYYSDMMIKAMHSSGLQPKDIDLVVPHGIGTAITDKYEASAISKTFGGSNKMPLITALKPYVGHALGSAAILETALMLIGLRNKQVIPTINCDNPDDSLGIEILREASDADEVKFAMKTACGFAGFDGACIFRKM